MSTITPTVIEVLSHPLTVVLTLAAAAGGGMLGAYVAIWQGVLSRRSLRAQSLLTLQDLAIRAKHAEGMAAVRRLKSFSGWEEYSKSPEFGETQPLVYETVNFLNFAAHLIQERAIPRQTVWNLYFFSYRDAAASLLSWWLPQLRKENPHLFDTFERMCRQAASKTPTQIHRFDRMRPIRAVAVSAMPWLLAVLVAIVLISLVYLLLLAMTNWPLTNN